MKIGTKEITIKGPERDIRIKRNTHGIPVISAESFNDLMFGQGWVHATDRQLQAILTRLILQGRTSEFLAGTDELIEVDKYIRKMNFLPKPGAEIKKLKGHAKKSLQAYCDGFNSGLAENGTVWEFRLAGYRPEPWEIKDCLVLAKTLGFFGQTDTIGLMKKFIVQLIQNDIPEGKIRELFPGIDEKIDYELIKKIVIQDSPVPSSIKWLSQLMAFRGSNNWAISPEKTETGGAFFCNDPHLEINRLPSVWRETVMKLPDNYFVGVDLPGFPGLVIGRNSSVSWGVTFSYMDMMDFRIEHCMDGKYRRGQKWIPFKVREEKIIVKKKKVIVERFYENEEGVLEGDPFKKGYYLSMKWAAQHDTGAEIFNNSLDIENLKDVKKGMKVFQDMHSIPANWVLADTKGNIGYQMSGRLFKRPAGYSGLLPIPAWDGKIRYGEFTDSSKHPASYNPAEGFIVTANNDLNHLGSCRAINLCFAPYRAERISALIKSKEKCTMADMKDIQLDLYSIQAEKLMLLIRPDLPDTENGKILRDWDMRYSKESCGAVLFESVYRSFLKIVFGEGGTGRDAMKYLIDETSIVTDFFGNFDSVLLKTESDWFNDETRDSIIKKAIEEGLSVRAEAYGKKHNVTMSHLLFGGKLSRFMGFNHGPVVIEGSRATVNQGQIFRTGGRTTSFCPSYRIITDMGTDEIHTNLPGGPTDRRFSGLYITDVKNWLKGKYKVLSGGE